MKHLITRRLACLALALTGLGAHGQGVYPSKPVRIIVPFGAGGPADALARALAAKLTPLLGQQFVVENKAGGGSIIGWDAVAKSAPDGYTLLLGGSGTRTILPSISSVPFDPAKDFTPITMVARSPNILVAGAGWPTGSMKDLIAFSRANPGKLAIANPAPGTLTHMASIVMQAGPGISLNDIPYKGGAPAVTGLLGGEVQLMMADISVVLPHLQSGKIRGLMLTSARRSPLLPEVPTAQEVGIDNLVAENAYALFAPAGTPRVVIDRLAAAAAKALKEPDLTEQFGRQGFSVEGSTPEALESYLAAQTTRWAPVAKSSGVRLN